MLLVYKNIWILRGMHAAGAYNKSGRKVYVCFFLPCKAAVSHFGGYTDGSWQEQELNTKRKNGPIQHFTKLH